MVKWHIYHSKFYVRMTYDVRRTDNWRMDVRRTINDVWNNAQTSYDDISTKKQEVIFNNNLSWKMQSIFKYFNIFKAFGGHKRYEMFLLFTKKISQCFWLLFILTWWCFWWRKRNRQNCSWRWALQIDNLAKICCFFIHASLNCWNLLFILFFCG